MNVLSLGCGLCQDYYALAHSLTTAFIYRGYDAVAWKALEHLPEARENRSVHNIAVQDIPAGDLHAADLVWLPKSITDIDESGAGILRGFAQKLAKTHKRRVFLVVSYATADATEPARTDLTTIVHDTMIHAGFGCDDDPASACSFGGDGIGLRTYYPDFVYPNEWLKPCAENSKSECTDCDAKRSPILTTGRTRFSILEYTR
ncbi:hypothetical protein GCM10009099_40970 [Caenispirillum bisanense]